MVSVRTAIAASVRQPGHTGTASPHQRECIDLRVCREARREASPARVRLTPAPSAVVSRRPSATAMSVQAPAPGPAQEQARARAWASQRPATPATAAATAAPRSYASLQRAGCDIVARLAGCRGLLHRPPRPSCVVLRDAFIWTQVAIHVVKAPAAKGTLRTASGASLHLARCSRVDTQAKVRTGRSPV